MHYLADYGLFLAKILTLVVALLLLILGIAAAFSKNKDHSKGGLHIKKLNKKYDDMQDALHAEILPKKQYKIWHKETKKKDKEEDKSDTHKRRIFVLHFNGDIKASAVEQLRDEITAILCVATPRDEVVLNLESAGGIVHSYGLAASQLQRIKDHQIPLTIIIDKIAASGGYLMACVGHKILAAPFAIIGSIGVIAQLPNFHRLLEENNIDFEQITAGKFKRTLTLFGKNTEEAREKLKEEIEEIHYYFKSFIQHNRSIVDIEKISTGEHWIATKAIELKLIDGLSTSDEYLYTLSKIADIFEVSVRGKKSFMEKISGLIQQKTNVASIDYLFQ
jgi:serine protease SohB